TCGFYFSRRCGHTRISRDWSSDVCSSDLTAAAVATLFASPAGAVPNDPTTPATPAPVQPGTNPGTEGTQPGTAQPEQSENESEKIGRASCRERGLRGRVGRCARKEGRARR